MNRPTWFAVTMALAAAQVVVVLSTGSPWALLCGAAGLFSAAQLVAAEN